MGVKGVKEYFQDDLTYFHMIENSCIQILSQLGYEEFKPPILEYENTFNRGLGKGSDIIVNKEMFYLADEEKKIVLRPEFTPLVAKTYVEKGFAKNNPVWKLFYIGPCFRKERPQKGRLREFHQAGIEIIGDKNILYTLELFLALKLIFSKLGIENYTLNINSLGCPQNCRKKYLEYLKKELENKLINLCDVCKTRFKKNPLRILDCKVSICKDFIRQQLKPISTFLCQECENVKAELFDLLKKNNIFYIENEYLVRGFDYYTGIVFEYTHPSLGGQDAFCGGGRYDNLLHEFSEDQPEGAVGCGLGIERTILILKQANLPTATKSKKKVYIAFTNIELMKKNFYLTEKLLNNGFEVFSDYSKPSLKAHLKKAESIKADYTIILGDEEIKDNKILCKRMSDSHQIKCNLEEVVKYLNTLSN